MTKGKTLKIFVMGEDPSSFKTVELSNWVGKAFFGERRHIGEVKKRLELSQPGVYFLLADSPDSEFTDIYVGESDDFVTRIKHHGRKRDWWTKFVVFISKDKNLTKAHVRYLEKKLYSLANESIGTLRVKNESEPSGSKLPESDMADMEVFLENMIFTLAALGLGYFSTRKTVQKTSKISISDSKVEEYEGALPYKLTPSTGKRLKSHLVTIGGLYILKTGSYIRSEPQPSFLKNTYYKLWEQIVNSKDVEKSKIPKILVLKKDIEFKSPSAAGAVVRGRATNGRTMWKRKIDEKTLGWVESQ